MKRLSKEEYRRAKGCLQRYNYNCINIINIQSDILSLSVSANDRATKSTIFSRRYSVKESNTIRRRYGFKSIYK